MSHSIPFICQLGAAAAYRSGTKLTNEWDGMTHDYTLKGGIVHAEIMLPAYAPPEFADRSIPVSYTHLLQKQFRTSAFPFRKGNL